MNKLLILGAGQYGMLAREIALSTGNFEKVDFLDDNSEKAIGKINDICTFKKDYNCAFVAIGDRDIRQKLFNLLVENGYEIPNIISPQAYIAPSVILGKGVIIEPMAVVHTDCTVGNGCFICAGAVINHNSQIKDFCHINCHSTVAARQSVPEKTVLHYNKVFQH